MIDKGISYEDQRLTKKQKKKIKPANQGGGPNYLGKQETVTVPKKWLSDPDHVVAELAYITPREKKILIDLDLYGSLNGKPNTGPAGIPSLQGDMGGYGGTGGGGGNSGGGDGMAGERAREARERAAQAAREAAQARAAASAREQAAERSRQEAAQKAAAEKAAQQREQAREQQYSAPAPAPVAPTTTTTTSDDGYVDRIQRIAEGIEPGYTPTSDQPFGLDPEEAYMEGKITKDQYEDTIERMEDQVEEPDSVLDDINPMITLGGLIMGGGIPSLYQGVSYLNNAGYLDFGPFNNQEFFNTRVRPSGAFTNYDDYMKARTSGEVDAYGNKLSPQEDGNPLRDLLFAKQQQQQQNVNPLKQVVQQNPYDRFFKELNIIY